MIAREGVIFIVIGLALTVALLYSANRADNSVLFVLAVVAGLLTIFTTYFFRDPEREIPQGSGILVSPADGKVLGVETVSHPFVGDSAVKVSIFLNVFDVHVNRIPAAGTVSYVKYNPGKFFAAFEEKASELNEQTEIGLEADTGDKIVFKQIAGLIARRIVCKVKAGDRVAAGERFGMIRFGSRTELFLPKGSQVKVAKGDRVAGGASVIGLLPKVGSTALLKTGEEHGH